MVSPSTSYGIFFRSASGKAVVLLAVSLLGYFFWVVTRRYEPETEQFISSLLLVIFSLVFAFFAFRLHRNKEIEARMRRGWFYLALAGFSNAIAEAIVLKQQIAGPVPFLSTADIFYVLYYPLLLVGVLSFPIAPSERRERIILWLDLAIVMTTTFMLFWYFILVPAAEEGLRGIVAVFYPAGDLLILAALAALIQRNVEKMAWWTLFFLGCGMACNVFADGFFAYFQMNQFPYNEPNLNILYLISLIWLQVSVTLQSATSGAVAVESNPTFSPTSRLLRLALPYLAVVIGLGVLFMAVESETVSELGLRGVLYGSLALVALVMLRQYVVLQENVHLYREMQTLAITDGLTGVHNRRFANESLENELRRALRYSRPLSILLLDVDGFKQYNDKYGHLNGDVALKRISEFISAQLRLSDLLARFGGDEFLAILPETDQQGARVVADKMKRAISDARLESLSLSVGMASFRSGMHAEQLLEEADQDLYRQKELRKTR